MSSLLTKVVAGAQENRVLSLAPTKPLSIQPMLTADSRVMTDGSLIAREENSIALSNMISEYPELFECGPGASLAINVRRLQTEFAPQYPEHPRYRRGLEAFGPTRSARQVSHEAAGAIGRLQAEMDALNILPRMAQLYRSAQIIMGKEDLLPLSMDLSLDDLLDKGTLMMEKLETFASETDDEVFRASALATRQAMEGIVASIQTALGDVILLNGERSETGALLYVAHAGYRAHVAMGRQKFDLNTGDAYDVKSWRPLQLQGNVDAFLVSTASMQLETLTKEDDIAEARARLSDDHPGWYEQSLARPTTMVGTGVRTYEYYANGFFDTFQLDLLQPKTSDMSGTASISLPSFEHAVLAVVTSGTMLHVNGRGMGNLHPLVLLPKPDGSGHRLSASSPTSVLLAGPVVR